MISLEPIPLVCVYLGMKQSKHNGMRAVAFAGVILGMCMVMSGCALQQRRVEIKTASGADDSLDDRFGLSDDAQDPAERDKELGYGRWKAKPEPTGTTAPTSPDRRGSSWNGSSK